MISRRYERQGRSRARRNEAFGSSQNRSRHLPDSVLLCGNESDRAADGEFRGSLNLVRCIALVILALAALPTGTVAQKLVSPPEVAAPPQLPPPAAGEQHYEPPADEHQNTQPDRRGTIEAPIVVEMHYPPKTDQQAAENAAEEDRKEANDRWTFRLTLALVVATVFQFFALGFQGYWLWRTVRTAEKAAGAVEAIERPYFVLETLSGFEVRREKIHRIYVNYTFANIGRTPAIVDELKANFVYSDTPPVPPNAYVFPSSTTVVLRDRAFSSNGRFCGELPILIGGLNFSYDPVMPNTETGKCIYLIILAKYRDVAERPHETAICRIRSAESGGFVKYGGNKYNYMT